MNLEDKNEQAKESELHTESRQVVSGLDRVEEGK